MSIVFSAITPHSPVLIPSIGKEHAEKFSETRHARLRIASAYTASFERFGDLVTSLAFSSDPVLADRVKNDMHANGYPMLYDTSEKLGYEASVPLFHLMKNISAKVLVLNPGHGTLKKQFSLGKELQKVLQQNDKRIACIASGDLAHAHNDDEELMKQCSQFDHDIVTFLKAEKTKKILSTSVHTVKELSACGLPPLATLLGVMDHMKTSIHIHSYERPLGVGFLVADYSL
jgi:aromatic ring-opening dioxygenase LigB subunit